ncbi:uncharacterized protein LOC110931359 [Helianthus annuus]|uniref:uncharacterized protein LOC110931359 n=1 Tax=Helianthus annuus TaxID=4232 RepID=UPI000B9046FE|nr:uncharacterized protein LOC110931359 [Helianthus annuus]
MPPRWNINTNPLPRTEAELNEHISLAIAQHEALRSEQSGGTSGNNPPTGCTYKQFLDCKLLNFDGAGGAVAFVRWVKKTDSVLRMSKCLPEQRVTYISRLSLDGALSWWNLQVQTKGEAAAYAMSWDELKELMRKKYCTWAEIQKLETEFWNLKMDGPKIAEYIQRFHDLSRVVPYLVEPEFKRIERFIWGLAPEILSMATASKPPTIIEAIDLSVALTEEAPRLGKFSKSGPVSMKIVVGLGMPKIRVGLVRDAVIRIKEEMVTKVVTVIKMVIGTKVGMVIREENGNIGENGNQAGNGNHGGNNNNNNQAGMVMVEAKAVMAAETWGILREIALKIIKPVEDFVSIEFKNTLDLVTSKLDVPYSIELANGKLVEASEVIKGCTLELGEREFSIDLLPVDLGSFDVVVGMDWLSDNRAEVVCHKKTIRIPLLNGETLVIHGEKRETPLRIINCMKAQKCLRI